MSLIKLKKEKKYQETLVRFYFLGINIFKTKLSGSYKKWCLFGVPIWKQNINKKTLKSFFDLIIEKYPSCDDYYVFLSRSGEFFLLMHHLKEWIKKNQSENFVLIFSAKYHLNICKMFFPKLRMEYIKNLNVPVISRGVEKVCSEYKGKKFYIPTYEKYFTNVENLIRKNNAHYYELLKKHVGLNELPDKCCVSQDVKEKISNFVKHILKNNFVFISPESLSNKLMEKSFWEKLVQHYKNLGYEVFCNVTDIANYIDGTVSMFLTFEESVELSKYAQIIIGLRSGFLECLSQNNVPMHVLYTDFPKRPSFKRLESCKVKTGFSISKLPHVNSELLFEYDVNSFKNTDEIIENIIQKI